MVVCRFWQRGDCRNGDACRFEHPGLSSNNTRGSFTNSSQVRSSNGNRGQFDTSQESTNVNSRPENEYKVTAVEIDRDLAEPPIWILSSYGPGKDAPVQLFGGVGRELSVEEARYRYYRLVGEGHTQEAKILEDGMIKEAYQQLHNARSDTQGAVQYIIEGSQRHPNRIDVCRNISMTVNRSAMQHPPMQGNIGASYQMSPFSKTSVNQSPFDRSISYQMQAGQSSSSRPSPFGPSSSSELNMAMDNSDGPRPSKQQPSVSWGAFGAMADNGKLSSALQSPLSSSNVTEPNSLGQPIRTKDVDGKLKTFNGQSVIYEAENPNTPYFRRPDGRLQMIWFPDGKTFNKPEDLPLGRYDSQLEETYRIAKQNGAFKDGKVPELPPKREWMSFNF